MGIRFKVDGSSHGYRPEKALDESKLPEGGSALNVICDVLELLEARIEKLEKINEENNRH